MEQPDRPCGDAIVLATRGLYRWLLLVERADGRGWAVPGGRAEPSDGGPVDTAARELMEETGLHLPAGVWRVGVEIRVPDERFVGGWVATVPCVADLGVVDDLPFVWAGDGVVRAEWVQAGSFDLLVRTVSGRFGGVVYPPHLNMLADVLR